MQDKNMKEQAAESLRAMIVNYEEETAGMRGAQEQEELESLLWETLRLYAGETFRTAKGLEFTYFIRGHEMFVSRKDKSLTRATVLVAFYRALDLAREGKEITGPKKLGTFGASYLYPVFIGIGVIRLG